MTKEQKRFELIAQYAGIVYPNELGQSFPHINAMDWAIKLADETMKLYPQELEESEKVVPELSARELVRRMQGYCESHALCCMQTDNLFDWAKKELKK